MRHGILVAAFVCAISVGVASASTQPSRRHHPLGPASVLRQHFADLNAGRFRAAFALMTPAYRRANPDWPHERSLGDPAVVVVSLGPARVRGASARVPVRFFARDRHSTAVSDTACREFRGSVEMVRIRGSWRYAPDGNNLSARIANGDRRCPR